MGLGVFKHPKSDWMKELEERVEDREYSLTYLHISANSHYFLITGNEKCAIGKTHHTWEEERSNSYISLNSVEAANWKDNPEKIQSKINSDCELVDIFGVVIDHRSPNGYQQDQDNFLVMTEDILEEIPESGKKEFRITSSGYRHPFGKHVNSWDRFFKNLY